MTETVGLILAIVAFVGFAVVGIVLSVIDVRTHRLPDAIVLPAWAAALVLLVAASAITADAASAWGAVLGGLGLFAVFVLARIVSPASLGGGDVKLAGVVGTYLGWLDFSVLLVGVAASFILGGLVAGALLLSRRATRTTRIPFGPFMLGGAWLGVVAWWGAVAG